MPYSAYVNLRFGGTKLFHLQGRKIAEQETSLQQVARLLKCVFLCKYERWPRPSAF
jgi:hypothetical protein